LSYPRVVQFAFVGLGAAERLSRRAAHRIIGSIASHIIWYVAFYRAPTGAVSFRE